MRVEMIRVFEEVHDLYKMHGYDCICTCSTDSHGPDDPHTHGFALDFRTRHIPNEDEKRIITKNLQDILGSLYYVQYEPGQAEHIHVQIRKDIWRKLL